MTLPVHWWQ